MDFEAAKAVCRTFPGATEDLKWGEVKVFSVGGKMFAATNADLPAMRISDSETTQLLRRSYELAFSKLTKKLQRQIGEAA